MDRQTLLIILALGLIGGSWASTVNRRYQLKKARALRASYRPRFQNGCHLVRITHGPKWAIGEFGTFDAAENKILIEGEEFDAEKFEFILA